MQDRKEVVFALRYAIRAYLNMREFPLSIAHYLAKTSAFAEVLYGINNTVSIWANCKAEDAMFAGKDVT